MNRITADNFNPIITVTNRRWNAPRRMTLEQVLNRLRPLRSDSEADINRKIRAAHRLPTQHPAVKVAQMDLLEHLCEALEDFAA